MTETSLQEALDEARIVKVHPRADVVATWHGGHGVNFYRFHEGYPQEVHYTSVGDFVDNHADPDEVREAIEREFDELDW